MTQDCEKDSEKPTDQELFKTFEVGWRGAREELALRYQQWIRDWVAFHGAGLSFHDKEEAVGDLTIVLLQAIDSYHRACCSGAVPGLSFRTLVHLRIPDRFKDFLEERWVKAKLSAQPLEVVLAVERDNGQALGPIKVPADKEDPQTLAQRHELMTCVDEFGARVAPKLREAWPLIVRDEGLAAISAAVKRSPKTAQRYKKELQEKCQPVLRAHFVDGELESWQNAADKKRLARPAGSVGGQPESSLVAGNLEGATGATAEAATIASAAANLASTTPPAASNIPSGFCFDSANRVLVITDCPSGTLATMVYDAAGRTTPTTDPVRQETFSFDEPAATKPC